MREGSSSAPSGRQITERRLVRRLESGWGRMSPFALLQVSSLAAFAILLVAAGWQDLRTMRIANSLSLAVIGCFAGWALGSLILGTSSLATVALSFVCAALLFGVGALGFAVGVL